MNPVRSRDIRESNEKLILRIIREGEGVSQSDVVGLTGLRAPTVLRFFNSLESEGFIRVADRKPDIERRGRKPVYYEAVPDALFVMGMEFWAESISVAILDFAGSTMYSRCWPMNPADRGDVINKLTAIYRDALRESGTDADKLLGLCVAAPGQVNIDTGELVQYSRLGIADINLREVLEKELDVPVLVHNNAAAVAWDECRMGICEESRSLFMIMIRAGVGGAFIDDGEIFVTKTHTTLEIGHIAVEYDGRPCDCGSSGCLETYLSEGALLEDLAAAGNPKDIAELDALISEGRPEVGRILDEKAGLLAQAVRNLISLFGPEMFLIVSRSEELGRYLADRVRAEVLNQASRRWQGRTLIESATYDPENAGRGAADMVFRDYFSS